MYLRHYQSRTVFATHEDTRRKTPRSDDKEGDGIHPVSLVGQDLGERIRNDTRKQWPEKRVDGRPNDECEYSPANR